MQNRPNLTMKKRLVLGITRMTVHNGPGIRTLVQFKGCPLRCVWCSTPESQKTGQEIAVYPDKCIHCDLCLPVCPSNAIRMTDKILRIDRVRCNNCGQCTMVCHAEALRLLGQEMTVEEIVKEVKKDEIAYKYSGGGVTLSGGEPLLEMEFTLELLRALSENNISVGVNTCGYIPAENLELTLPYIDFFLYDIKIMDEQKHKEFTVASNRLILENLKLISNRGIPIYIRIPLIPGYNDSTENIKATCEFIRGLASLVEIDLLPLHHLGMTRYTSLDRLYPITGIPLISETRMQEIKSLVESYRLNCTIVG